MSASFSKPKEPGTLSDDARSYRIPHRSKFFLPWVIEAEPPTWRDLWAVLRGRYRPKLKVRIGLTAAGYGRILKDVWTGPKIQSQFYEAGPLQSITSEGDAA